MSKLQNYFQEASLESLVEEMSEEQLALQMQAIEMAAKEVEEVEEDVEELEEIEEGLESIAASMETVLEKGALDPVAAQFAHHAVQGYVGRLGLESDKIVHSLESFGTDTSAETATVASLEGIKDTIAKVWAAIKAAVSKVFKAIGDFFAKLFGGVDALEKKNKELAESVDKAISDKYEAEKGAKVSVGAPNALKYLGKVDSKSVLQGLDNLLTVTTGPRTEVVKGLKTDIVDYAKNIISIKKGDEKIVDEALAAMSDSNNSMVKVFTKTKSVVMSGDKVATATSSDDKYVTVYQLETHPKAKPYKGDGKEDVYALKDLKTIIDNTGEVIKSIGESEKDIKTINEAYDDAVKAADDVYSVAKKDETIAKFVSGVKARNLLKGIRKPATKFIAKFDGYSFSVARSLQTLVKDNLELYSEKTK